MTALHGGLLLTTRLTGATFWRLEGVVASRACEEGLAAGLEAAPEVALSLSRS